MSNVTRVALIATDAPLAERAEWARGRRERRRGLLGRPPLVPGQALIVSPARQVHTIGMRYPIDVIFCDSSWTVCHIVRGLRPWRLTRWVRKARHAIELPAGAAGPEVVAGTRLAAYPVAA